MDPVEAPSPDGVVPHAAGAGGGSIETGAASATGATPPFGASDLAAIGRFVLGVFGFVVPFVPCLLSTGIALAVGDYAVATFLCICLLQSSLVFLWLLGSIADRFQAFVAGALVPGVLFAGSLAVTLGEQCLEPNADAGIWTGFVLFAGIALSQLVTVGGALRVGLRAAAVPTLLGATLAAVGVTAAFVGTILAGQSSAWD